MDNIKYVVTDVDGVLFDRLTINTKIFVEFVGRFIEGSAESAKKYYHGTQGTPFAQQLTGCVAQLGGLLGDENANLLYREYMERAEFERFELMSNAETVLKRIHAIGIPIFATSGSSTPFLEREFTGRGLHSCFTGVLGSNEIPKSLEHIKIFAKKMGVTLQEFGKKGVYVGDGSSDMQIARQAGLVGIGMIYPLTREELQGFGATYTIENLIELFDILKLG